MNHILMLYYKINIFYVILFFAAAILVLRLLLYRQKTKSWKIFIPLFSYGLFAIMAGICWDYGTLYPVRGLPVDASPEIANEYNADSTFFHHASWLSTEEFKNCLDKFTFYLTQRGVEPSEIEDRLKNYMSIYRYMQSSDADGEPARIVFWFDN